MLFLDSLILLLILGALHLIKTFHPNTFFFCKGAKLFLPPEWDESQKKKQVEVKIISIEYNHVKEFEMASEYERILFILIALILYIPVKILISWALAAYEIHDDKSTFCFLVSFVCFVYAIRIGLKILWISSYRFSYCILTSIGINVVFYLLRATFESLQLTYPHLNNGIIDYKRHLQVIFGKQSVNFGTYNILLVVLVLNTIITLSMIPSIIKFGTWYTTTLKEVFYDEMEENEKQGKKEDKKEKDPQTLKKQKQLKIKSKNTIFYLNMYLFTLLAFIFTSHPYFLQFLSQDVLDLIRFSLFSVTLFTIVFTLSAAIEFNGSYAYQYICEFFVTKQKQVRQEMIRKIIPYIKQIWYQKFQYMFRIMLPLFLCIIVIDWKYLHAETDLLQGPPVVGETHCALMQNQLLILENLYKCEAEFPKLNLYDHSSYNINGGIVGNDNTRLLKTEEKFQKYGILQNNFMTLFFEQLLWYNCITLFGMTIVYILFLRKAVYDI